MLVDGRAVPSAETIDADVCVVGGGPAGLTLARELGRRGIDVALVESGGLEPGPAQELARAERDDRSFQRLDGMPPRRLGGNANAWRIEVGSDGTGVRYLPLEELDFEHRAWLPHSGWPLSHATLEDAYARAAAHCGLERPRWWADERTGPGGAEPFPLDPSLVRTALFHVAPATAFTRAAVDELRRSAPVRVFLHLTVTGLDADAAGERVERVTARRPDGAPVRFRARRVVLAAGGAENPRLLLVSGLGNAHGLVGRFFMEHPFVRGGVLEPAGADLVARAALYDLRPAGGNAVLGHLALAPEVRRREELLAVGAVLFPRSRRTDIRTLEAVRALRPPRHGTRPAAEARRQAGRVLRGLPALPWIVHARLRRPDLYLTNFTRGGWSRYADAPRRLDHFETVFCVEQAPDPENRIVLGRQRDRFGIPLPRLVTRWGGHEQRSVRRTREVLAAAFEQAGVGRLVADEGDGGADVIGSTAHHHLGTTRMAEAPSRGVVDADGRVHGLANLFVAGSSVFPTGGYANPTLTIVALAVRLADHLAAG